MLAVELPPPVKEDYPRNVMVEQPKKNVSELKFEKCTTPSIFIYWHHTADGTRIPNLGQKTLETVSEDGSTQLSQTFQIADISRPLTSVGELADAGNLVVFGRKGGFIVNSDTGRRLNFQREHGVYFLKTWSQEPASSTSVFSRQG